ncbi:hypothetical protein L5876_09705 [Hyphobacterium sp. SN044]|uniref:hypothetical protein n=1 Tax=Hyphobacterium sp. SN044 TaxID=2912575 RepID=UPI001F2A40D6|nr:hypothetical protein [Hyphobacterium sp. SN044]MCF8880089.1 hypothetical protein [Hyphobacterium sp. SN044]
MTDVKFTKPENRLAATLRRPGGLSPAEAVRQASSRLKAGKAQYEMRMDGAICELCKAECTAGVSPDSRRERLSRLANDISELAGASGLDGLSEAARSLHLLAEAAGSDDLLDDAAVKVHIASIRLLREQCGAIAREDMHTLLSGLNRLIDARMPDVDLPEAGHCSKRGN